MERPLFNCSIEKLEEEYRAAKGLHDKSRLLLVSTELSFRKTSRAFELAKKIQDALEGLDSTSSSTSKPPTEPNPAPNKQGGGQGSARGPRRSSRNHSPTEEQADAILAFQDGGSLKINAFAGTGKTSTLEMIAHSSTRRGQYIAFNRNIVEEAKDRFPESVSCATTHGLAFRAAPSHYKAVPDKMVGKVNAHKLGDILNLPSNWHVDQHLVLDRVAQASIILKTIQRFTQSADPLPSVDHVPTYGALLGAETASIEAVSDFALRGATHVWKRMMDPQDQMPLGHDGYLKLWALSDPYLSTDYILLDEAQDTNPVVLSVLEKQDAQLVYVGDRYQQIYEWRGAINAMETIKTHRNTTLRRSFRFGEPIAQVATRVLRLLGENDRLIGNPRITSSVCSTCPNAVLARTNATTITALLAALDAKQLPHLVGGINELMELLRGVDDLKRGMPSSVPEFFGFQNWNEVVQFSETTAGEHLITFVKLVESRGEKQLMWALNRTVEEGVSTVVISTAHKAKGREWTNVRLMDDFMRSKPSDKNVPIDGTKKKQDPAEFRLLYVALTRAREQLEISPSILNLIGVSSTPPV